MKDVRARLIPLYEWGKRRCKIVLENNFNSWEDLCFFAAIIVSYVITIAACTYGAHARGHRQGIHDGFQRGFRAGVTVRIIDEGMNRAMGSTEFR